MELGGTDETSWQNSYSYPENVGEPEFANNELSCFQIKFKAAQSMGCRMLTRCLQLGLQEESRSREWQKETSFTINLICNVMFH